MHDDYKSRKIGSCKFQDSNTCVFLENINTVCQNPADLYMKSFFFSQINLYKFNIIVYGN